MHGNVCVWCKERKCNRPKGLCWRCYTDPVINRQTKGRKHRYSVRAEVQDFCGMGEVPTPTHHMPGTEGKVEVLEYRAQHRQQLFHRDDPVEAGRGRTEDEEVQLRMVAAFFGMLEPEEREPEHWEAG